MKVTTIYLGLEKHTNHTPQRPLYVIMPAYNEAAHPHFINAIMAVAKLDWLEKLIVVNDGSTDDTKQQVGSLLKGKNSLIDLVNNEENLGKEGAIKNGLNHLLSYKNFSSNSWIALMDSNGQPNPKDIGRMLYAAEKSNADFICCYRKYKGMPLSRTFANIGMRLIWNSLIGYPIKDVQFGLKLINGKHTEKLAKELRLNGGYQVELSLTSYLLKNNVNTCQIPVGTEYEKCSGESGMGMKNLNWVKQLIYVSKLVAKKHLK